MSYSRPPAKCPSCQAEGRIVIEKFGAREYGHDQCLACGITFDSNIQEILREKITRERIEKIENNKEYMKLFVETREIASDEGEIYTKFDWDNNDGVKEGVARHIFETVDRHGISTESPRILDLGCGNGFTTIEYAKRFGAENIVGVDPSPMVHTLAERHGIQGLQGTLDSLELPEESFDAVFIIGNLMLHPNPIFTLKETQRVLKPGGLIIFDYKNISSIMRRLAIRAARMSPNRFAKNHLIQRNFVNMRYSFDKKYISNVLRDLGIEELETYSKPPRLLEFSNASGYQKGLKGMIWRFTDWIDGLRDERAWVQVAARKR